MTNFGAAIDDAVAPVAAPPIVMPLPGLPVLVFIPNAPMSGTMEDWAYWGWRPFTTRDRVTTATDG